MPSATAAWPLLVCLALPGLAHAETDLRGLATAPATAGATAEGYNPAAAAAVDDQARWVLAHRDAGGLSFLIIDKVNASLSVFTPEGRLLGVSPVLLGAGRGDVSPPGIGSRKLSTITPAERITPAGRFVATLGRNFGDEDIVWVDYDAAVSLHRVVTHVKADRRLERLATPTPLDNRISYGCINVPRAFYDNVVRPIFLEAQAIIYVLPESVEAARAGSGSWRPSETTPPHGVR